MAQEKAFENKIKRLLEENGIYALGTPKQKMITPPRGYWEKRWGGGNFTKSGLPDMHITIFGKSFDIEIKAAKGKPSELQLFTIAQINRAGGNAFVLYPEAMDVEEFRQWLNNKYPEYANVPAYDNTKFKEEIIRRNV